MKKEKNRTYLLIISGILTFAICAVMNFAFIPLIESTTEGIRMFDMNTFGYSFEQAKSFVSLLSEKGMHIYLYKQLPLDFVYPVVYTMFFTLCLSKLTDKRKIVCIFPLSLMIFDYLENALSIVMLTTDFSESVAAFASFFTIVKSILMYITIILILIMLILKLIKSRKKQQ